MDSDQMILIGEVGRNTEAVARKLRGKGRNGFLTLEELQQLSNALRHNADTIEIVRKTYIEREI